MPILHCHLLRRNCTRNCQQQSQGKLTPHNRHFVRNQKSPLKLSQDFIIFYYTNQFIDKRTYVSFIHSHILHLSIKIKPNTFILQINSKNTYVNNQVQNISHLENNHRKCMQTVLQYPASVTSV